jgi:hypothetical protein
MQQTAAVRRLFIALAAPVCFIASPRTN